MDVRGTPLNEQEMMVFCKALKVGSKLTSLQLERCGVNERCLIVLAEALRFLFLNFYNFLACRIFFLLMKMFNVTYRCNTSLQALTLSDNELSASDAVHLGTLLRANTTLRFLDVRYGF